MGAAKANFWHTWSGAIEFDIMRAPKSKKTTQADIDSRDLHRPPQACPPWRKINIRHLCMAIASIRAEIAHLRTFEGVRARPDAENTNSFGIAGTPQLGEIKACQKLAPCKPPWTKKDKS
jgi:hypothetical protein